MGERWIESGVIGERMFRYFFKFLFLFFFVYMVYLG